MIKSLADLGFFNRDANFRAIVFSCQMCIFPSFSGTIFQPIMM